MKDNPLLIRQGLPLFHQIEPSHIVPAVREVLKQAREVLEFIESSYQPTWEGLLKPLEELELPFEYAWSSVKHLLGVRNTPELRKAHQEVMNEVVEFSLRLRQSRPVFEGLKAIRRSQEWNSLTPARQRVIELKLLSSRLAGVGLEGEQRERFIEIEKELSQLSTDFSNHVLDATKAFNLIIKDKEDTEGWPPSLKYLAAQSYQYAFPETSPAATPDEGPWRITLDLPSFLPFLQHSRRREQREMIYHASITRASEGELDNRPLIRRILELRQEKARLLGYENYADLSLDTKMAPDIGAVEKMFEELKSTAEPFSDHEFEEVKDLAEVSGQKEELRQWDWPFWSERLRERRFDYTDEQLRPYFQLPKILDGLFSLAETLFSIKIREDGSDIPKWHEDVRYYLVMDEKDQQIASFYLDPYSRPHEKRGGAWMAECLNRRTVNGQVRLPVVHICCNGTPPISGRPSLMSFLEVRTLFHEFGHALQAMLTTVNEADVAGINGVEWDAVELPSQFLENWCYHKPTLMGLTEHVETGEPLPHDLFDKIAASRTFQSGYQTMRQLLFGMVDMRLHHQLVSDASPDPFDLYRSLAKEMSAFKPYEHDHFLCSFAHIFAGGYAAGYYSYKWAEVLSADAFAAFEEVGLDSVEKVREVGARFKKTVLSLGGSIHPMEVFRAFRGRGPDTKALMRHSGFIVDKKKP